jgi:hypothetical protein
MLMMSRHIHTTGVALQCPQDVNLVERNPTARSTRDREFGFQN